MRASARGWNQSRAQLPDNIRIAENASISDNESQALKRFLSKSNGVVFISYV